MWMTSIGLLTVSILFLSNQQTRLAVEQGHQIGRMEDRDYFLDHFQLPPSLTVDDTDNESAGSQEESSGRRGRQRQEKKPRNRKGKRDEKTSKALVVNDNNDSQRQKIQKQREHWHENRPPLESLITEKGKLQGDVSPLLDFAIFGHAKCATSFIMNWLSVHPEIQIFDREVCDLNEGRPADLVPKLYKELDTGSQYKRGKIFEDYFYVFILLLVSSHSLILNIPRLQMSRPLQPQFLSRFAPLFPTHENHCRCTSPSALV
jgi:hypothetical protein